MKILVATQKPFSAAAVAGIKEIVTGAGHEFAALEKYADASGLIAAVADVDALIIRSDKVTAEVLDAAKNLKIVVRAGAGYDNVDLAAATAHKVVVMNTPGQNSNAVAELAIAMMIYMCRNQFTPATGAEIQGKKVGIHAHNNQQLAFANTIEAVGDGVDYLDATYGCLGRGAGNCAMELLLGFLKNPKYNVYPAIQFIDNYMNKLKADGVVWGYDLQYMMTGQLNRHPREAMAFTAENRGDYCEFYKSLLDNF